MRHHDRGGALHLQSGHPGPRGHGEGREFVVTDLDAARADFGVVGRSEYGPLREALRVTRLSWRPIASLSLLGATAAVPLMALGIFKAEASRMPSVQLAWLAGMAAAGLAIARLAGAGWRRNTMAIAAGAVTAVCLALTALARATWPLAGCALLAGASAGAAATLHLPLLMDHYRPEVRLRMLSVYAGAVLSGMVAAGVVAAFGASVVDLTSRGIYLVLATLATIAVGAATPLADRAVGTQDALRVVRRVGQAAGGRGSEAPALADEDVEVGTAEKLRQVVATQTARPLLVVAAFWGLFTVADRRYLLVFWRERWNLHGSGPTWLYALVCAGGVVGLALAARRAEVSWRLDPERLVRLALGAGLLGAACLAASAAAPALALSVALAAAAAAGFAVSLPVIAMGLLSVVVPRLRAHAALLLGLAVVGGGIAGQQVLESIFSRFGARWALGVSAAVAAAIAVGLRDAARAIDGELNVAIGKVEEDELRLVAVSRGDHLPLLACRGIDFAYGQLQVLFDVNFAIDDGEIVALLGTNGAGKSTLLRVISGLGFPVRGSVHYRGSDITYVDAGRRVALGISQVPGGRAVFGPMSVLDNLRVFGFSHGRNQRAVEQGIDATFAVFPALATRRHQHAMTLSGGEQQMLALGKAFILKPRVLLIDELSLGLAPKVVADLLDMVRRINAAGTAVVLVEQSVNVALSLVDHAYFMEKGEIRFDGAATALVDRPDLLRSVFLEGAAGMTR